MDYEAIEIIQLRNHSLNYEHIYIGHAVAQLVEALSYKSEGRGFDFRWRHWNFSFT
jgi:hypothetical protein